MFTRPGERPRDYPSGTDKKAPVVSVLQRGGGVHSVHMPRVTSANLKPVINELVHESAHIMTDTSTALRGASLGRKLSQVNHSVREYVRFDDGVKVTTNTIEGYFSILKRGINGVYHHVGKQHLHRYLSEFDFRYNVREINDQERSEMAIRKTRGKRLMMKEPKAYGK